MHKTIYQIVFLFLLLKFETHHSSYVDTCFSSAVASLSTVLFLHFYFVISLFIFLLLVTSNPLFKESEWIQMWLQFKLYQVRVHSVLIIVLASGKPKYGNVDTFYRTHSSIKKVGMRN